MASCQACEAAGLPCVICGHQLGNAYHCVRAPEGCDASDCECMSVCNGGYGCSVNGSLECSCDNC